MSTTGATLSRWTRRFVVTGIAWFVCWQFAVATGGGRRVAVVLGLYGFVFHVLFGKAYALVPAYFDRELAVPRAPAVHLPLATGGTAAMALDAYGFRAWGDAGALAWAVGCLVFVAAIAWSVRDNVTGGETGTADSKAEFRGTDRVANGFVPVGLGYLLAGALLPVADSAGLAVPVGRGGPPVTHLLAAGGVALLLFAVGFRLLPRFLVVRPRLPVVGVVLTAGSVGPLMLVASFGGGWPFRVGAALEAVALVGFAGAYLDLFARSDRRRVGLYVVGAAAVAGAGLAVLGLALAFHGSDAAVAEAHARIALLGFLGLAIVGVSYQFYPPGVASVPGIDDRTAGAAAALLAVGLVVEVGGLLADHAPAVDAGRWVAVLGALCYAVVLVAVFAARRH